MSTLAIAALPVSPSTARDALGEPAEGDALFETAFGLVRLEALDDGIKLHLGLDFGEDPDRFGLAVRIALGDAVDGLEKVFVYPEVAKPSAATYEGLLAEVGDGGEWAPVASADEAAAAMEDDDEEGDAPDLFGALQAMMGGDLMGQVQSAMAGGGNDLASLAEQLMGNADLRATIQGVGEQLMKSGALEGFDPNGDVMAQAQRLAGQVAESNPELLEGLAKKAGVTPANDDEEEP
ncbi:MAG: hypothetical protein H6722_25090 [Sandaracinus sp.]|nr:hypothetical protein [Sandaracinus sp.]